MSLKSEWIRLLTFSIFFVSLAFGLRAQVVQNTRKEIPIKSDVETYSVISLDTAGIALYRNFLGPKENQLELTRLDTSLHQVWKGFIAIPKGLSLAGTKLVDNKIYFFFKGSLPGNRGFHVYVVRTKDGGYASYAITNVIQFNPTEFAASSEALLIGGYFNFRPLVLYYSLKDGHSHILPGFLNEPGELSQIKIYPDGNIDVIVSAKNNLRRKCLWIRHFDSAGDLVKTVVLEPEEHKNLIFGRAVKMENDNQVIAGVYGRNAEYSRGIFVAEINPYGEYIIRYYNFADLHNFFHYLKARREKRIKERIERRRIKGKKIKFNYRFLVHELIPYNNQFIMLGEAFYPTYTNRSNFYTPVQPTTYSPWSYGLANRNYYNPYRSDMMFDGFQYTHAVVIGFDTHAKLSWDNSFETNGLKSFRLEQLVKIMPVENKIALIYLYENEIRSKIIKDEQLVEGTIQEPVMTFDEKNQKNNAQGSKLEYWYKDHLFVYGIQNIAHEGASTRKLFFINKLRVR